MQETDRNAIEDPPAGLAPYPQEALLIAAVAEMTGERIACTSPGLAQFARAAALALPAARVSCTYLDAYRAGLAIAHGSEPPSNLQIRCAADLPDGEFDVVALPLSAGGEAELARELVQTGLERLRLGGKLYVSTDNPDDHWFAELLGKWVSRCERRRAASGVLYVATKTEPLRKVKDYSCEFAFRDRGRLIRALSRPGAFSHRHIDPGARHLIEAMEVTPGMRVLDIGCGAGTVALAAACRADGVRVHAVDSNVRAVECTERGAALNGLANVTTELNADGNYTGAGSFDLALANPPYYAGFRIARHFLAAGREALRPGGKLVVVSKHPAWYAEHMPAWYADVSMTERKGYWLFAGVRPDR